MSFKFLHSDFSVCPAYEPAAQDSADRANAKVAPLIAAFELAVSCLNAISHEAERADKLGHPLTKTYLDDIIKPTLRHIDAVMK